MSEMSTTGMASGAGRSNIKNNIPANKNDGSGLRDESEEGGWYERSDHPLLNDAVLREVFQHVQLRNLKACRGVCKKWNTSTMSFTRAKWWVKIDGLLTTAEMLHGFAEDHKVEETHGIEKFMQVFSKNQLGIPFAKFQLGSFCMTAGVGQEFIKLCGDLTKYIDISCDDSFYVEDLSELFKSTPNLMKLHIPRFLRSRSGNVVKLFPDHDDDPKPKLSFMRKLKSSWDYPEDRKEFCPTLIEELLMASENISQFTLKDSCVYDKELKCTSLEAMIAIEKLGRETFIQTLKFSVSDTTDDMVEGEAKEHFELLSRMQTKGLKLKRVEFDGKDSYT